MTPEQIAKLPYRKNVGIMVINGAGQVWVGRRADRHRDAWQMPQGGVDDGEDVRAAAFRELEEEIGVPQDLVELVAETDGWLSYDLPADLVPKFWGGKYRGQEQKWYLLRFVGRDDQINIATEHPEFIEWRWTNAATLVDEVVPFKRDVYAQVVAYFDRYL